MSSRSGERALRPGREVVAGLAALALCTPAAGAEIPRAKKVIDLDVIPGKLGAVRFRHAAHEAVGWKADRTPTTCKDCHHNLEADAPRSATEDLRCGGCHPGVGEPDRVVRGKRARAMAQLKPDGAIDFRTILFHDYCRDCHRKVQDGELKLSHCRLCHERPVGGESAHGRYDAVRQAGTDLLWVRCPAGQRWSGKRCEGEAARATWPGATGACPEGCRLPTRKEFLGVLEGCSPEGEAAAARCRPCGQSQACAELLGPDQGTYWVAAADGGPAGTVRLSDGSFQAAAGDVGALVRCVQTAP
jgi:hypothetical protein